MADDEHDEVHIDGKTIDRLRREGGRLARVEEKKSFEDALINDRNRVRRAVAHAFHPARVLGLALERGGNVVDDA